MMLCFLLLTLLSHLTTSFEEANLRPVVGVFAQRVETVTDTAGIDPAVRSRLGAYRYFIPASYVSWIGQAGGRVLPLLLDMPKEYYLESFEMTNGVLFPGGNQGIDLKDVYTEEGKIIWELAKAANDRGDYYPIWGTCLGFEEMAVLETNDGDVISKNVKATNLAMPLVFAPKAAQTSRLLKGMPLSVIETLQSKNVTFNSHEHGLLTSTYSSNTHLNEFFRVVSYNVAAEGKPFVSIMEAKSYPFTGVQFHPEKNNFEFSKNEHYSNIPHSSEAVGISQAMANFFLGEARRSEHIFPEDQSDDLIYSATLLYTGKGDWMYEQVYVF